MRLFIAIDISEDIKKTIREVQEELKEIKGLKLVQPDKCHLTLNFLGKRDDAEDIVNKLKTIKFEKFILKTNSLGVFPTEQYIQVIWLGLEENEELKKLQRSIDVYFKSDKSFRAHVTIARVKHISKEEKLKIIKILNKKIEEKSFEVDSFKLYQSNLTPLGPIYESLESFKAE
jgi:2'-5' RNA ligase